MENEQKNLKKNYEGYEMVDLSIGGASFLNFKSNIYVYDGIYNYNDPKDLYKGDVRCSSLKNADYLLYRSLINYFDRKEVMPFHFCREWFELGKIVIRFNKDVNFEENYASLKNWYFKYLFEGYTEDEIIEMIEEVKWKFGIESISVPITGNNKFKEMSAKRKLRKLERKRG